MAKDSDQESESEIDEELMLPPALADLDFKEKRRLLAFKHAHSEIEWEQEILRLQDLRNKQVDLERLQRLKGSLSTTKGKKQARKGGKSKASTPASASQKKKAGKPQKRADLSSDEEEEEEGSEEEEAEQSESDNEAIRLGKEKSGRPGSKGGSVSDDDLFDSDEEREISRKYAAEAAEKEQREEVKKKSSSEDDEGASSSKPAVADDSLDMLLASDDESEGAVESGGKKAGKSLGKGRRKSALQEREEKEDQQPKFRHGLAELTDSEEDDQYSDDGRKRNRKKIVQKHKKPELAAKTRGSGTATKKRKVDDEDEGWSSESGSDQEVEEEGSGDDVVAVEGGAESKKKRDALVDALSAENEVASDESPAASLEDYRHTQLHRKTIERMLPEPYFDEVVVGSFVRQLMDEKDNVTIYKMAEIVGVDRSPGLRSYRLPDSKQSTSIRLILSIAGRSTRGKVALVSNSRITQSELDEYLHHLRERHHKPLSAKALQKRRSRQRAIKNHIYTREEINSMVKKNVGLNRSVVTEESNALEKLRIGT